MLSHLGLEHIVPGKFGVTLFFFLSGYLITTLLRREIARDGRVDFRAFYRRRMVRILPPLYLTGLFFLLLSALGLLFPLSVPGLIWDVAFLSNYHSTSGMPIGLWSLAVEEHFYLAFPLLLALLSRRFSFAACAAVCAGLCALVLGVRLFEVRHLTDIAPITEWTHTRIDSILFGCILALWNNPVADERDALPGGVRAYLIGAALLLPTFAIRDEPFRQTLRYTLQGIALIVLFNAAIRDRGLVSRLLDNAAMRWIALLSYTIYLVHSGLIVMVERAYRTHPLLPTLAAVGLAFAYAAAMHQWVEKPLGRWRRARERAARGRSDAAPLAAAEVSAASGT